MKYDFTTVRDGREVGSFKWLMMDALCAGLPKDVVPLSVADMELPLAPEISEKMSEYLKTAVIGYTVTPDSYYDAVIRWMKRRHNWDITKEEIIPFQGVVPMIGQTIEKFTEKGDGILIMSPVYPPFWRLIETSERTLLASSLLESDGHYEIDFDDFREKAKKAKLLVLCSPHNPVGRVWKTEELKHIAAICKEYGLTVFSDEIHHDFIHAGHAHTVFAKIDPELPVLTGTAPTKTFNLAGAKVSNLIVQNAAIREKFGNVGDRTPSLLGLKIGQIAYDYAEPWLEEVLKLVKENEKVFTGILQRKAPMVKFSPIEGTYLLWMDLRSLVLSQEEKERFIYGAHFFPSLGEHFGPEGAGFVRVNLAAPTAVIEAAANRIGDAIKQRG